MVDSSDENRNDRRNADFSNMIKPENIGQTMRQFIPMGGGGMIENFADKIDILKDGGQLMQAAIHCGQVEVVRVLIAKGIDLNLPPNKVPPLNTDPTCHVNYRQSPYIIQAACAGALDVFKELLRAGCSIMDVGHICLSRRRQNSVAGNVISAACYHGRLEILKHCLKDPNGAALVDVKAIETADRLSSKGGPFKPELHDYTPLQLAVVSQKQNPNIIKLLFAKDANTQVRESTTGNNIVHLAAKHCIDTDVLTYVLQNAKVDVFERNQAGDTALTICQAAQNQRAVEIIEECQADFDDSAKKTDELMAELIGEMDKEEKARQRKKEKKHRSKLQKLAQARGCTVEQLEEDFKQQEELKAQQEKEREIAALKAEREAELAVQREKQEIIAQRQREHEEQLVAIEQERALERQAQAAERAKRSAARAEQQAQLQKQLEEQQKNNPTARGGAQEDQKETRKQQKKREFAEKKRYEEEQAALQAEQENDAETPGAAEDAAESELATGKAGVVGLTGEIAMKTLNKSTRKKMLEEQKRAEREREELKERIKKANLDREAKKVQAEKEARAEEKRLKKQQKEEKERKEEEARLAAIEAEKEAAKLLKIEAKKQKQAEKKREKKAAKVAAAKALEEGEEAKASEVQAPEAEQTQAQEKPKKSARQSNKPQQASEEPLAQADAQTEEQAPPQAKEKPVKEKKPKKEKKAKDTEAASAQKVYQVKKKSAQEEQPAEEVKAEPQPSQQKTETAGASSDQLRQMEAELVRVQKELKKMEKAKQEAERLAKSQVAALADQQNQNKELQEQLLEMQQDSGMHTSVNERELNKQIKKLVNQLQQQITVNKTLSSKLMIQEKSFIDEKRHRLDLEKRLSAALASRPPSGPGGNSSSERTAVENGGRDELSQMQYSLASVNQRVSHHLSGNHRQ